MLMKLTTIKFILSASFYDGEIPGYGTEVYICSSKLRDYFDIPQGTKTIYLSISAKELPEGYRCYVPHDYSDIRMYTSSNQSFRETLSIAADCALISLGLIGKPFYINLQYEEES